MDVSRSHSNPRPFAKPLEPVELTEGEKRQLLKEEDGEKLANQQQAPESTPSSPYQEPVGSNIPRVLHKPIFIRPSNTRHEASEDERERTEDARQRRREAKRLAERLIAQDKAKDNRTFEEQRIAGTPFNVNSVDDTDGLDDAAEEAAWREREKQRISWETAERRRAGEEENDTARRRGMTEEERQRQDVEKAKKWTEGAEAEDSGAGQYRFLQRYYHKGAFYQQDSLLLRDYAQATGVDSGVHRDTLPSVMQVKNFGRKGRSKWTHLAAEDTTSHGWGWGDKDNPVNYESVPRMGGMRGDLENPARKKRK